MFSAWVCMYREIWEEYVLHLQREAVPEQLYWFSAASPKPSQNGQVGVSRQETTTTWKIKDEWFLAISNGLSKSHTIHSVQVTTAKEELQQRVSIVCSNIDRIFKSEGEISAVRIAVIARINEVCILFGLYWWTRCNNYWTGRINWWWANRHSRLDET